MERFNLSAWAVAHRALVGFLIVLLFAAGARSYTKLGRAEDPSFTVKLAVVTAQWPGATAQEMQEQVAERIERKLQDLAWLDHLDTFVRPGVSATLVSFRDNTPPAQVPDLFYQTRKKLEDLRPSLPAGLRGPFVNDEYADVYGAVFALFGTEAEGTAGPDNTELIRQAESIRDRLRRLPGAEKVTILGEIQRTLFVEFSHARLATLGVTVGDVADAIARQNGLAPAGLVETGTTRIPVRVDGAVDGATALAAVPVAAGGRSVRLSDLATITPGHADPPDFSVRHNGRPAVVIAVSSQKGTDGQVFGATLRAEADRIRAGLPLGFALQQAADQPAVIAEAVGEFLLKFVAALGVVLVVSFLSLGWRSGIVVALAVPLTLSIVFIVMDELGIELQRISLGALILSLGLLVDDAIISIETMVVKLEEGWDRVRAASFAWTSTAFPMLTGTLVTAAGFLPVGIAQSTTGEYAGGIFWVVGLALLASWVVAVLFTPFLGVLLLPSPRPGAHHDHAALYDTRAYRLLRRAVRLAVRHRGWMVTGTVLLLLVAGGGMSLVKKQFFPNSARTELLIDVKLRQGASHAATEATVHQVEQALAADDDVLWYTSYIGAGPPRFFLAYNPALPNDALATIVLTTRDPTARERVRARLQALAAREEVPSARLRVSRLELGPPVGFPVQFRVVGTDLDAVRKSADAVMAALRATPGTRDVQLAWGERAPSVRLELDQARVRELGLAPAEIARALSTLLSGLNATQLRDGTKLVDVVLRAVPGERLDLDHLPDFMLPTSAGPVALSQVARLVPTTEDPILWRRDREPYLTVQADIQDGLQAPDVTAAALPRLAAVPLPPGVRIETGGATEEATKANGALYAVFPLMVGAMVLLLMIQLQDLRRVLLVLATAPLGIIGAVAALLLADAPFGFVALLGLISLSGMVMRNSVILVDQVRQDLEAGASLADAIVESTVRRTRPVVLTALASALAFVPLTLNVFWGPMALAMIGGLIGATVLTLLYLPALTAMLVRSAPIRGAAPAPPGGFASWTSTKGPGPLDPMFPGRG
ncbi:Efflux RND transporter permease subunit [Rhodovastum atsumiense]|uniref:Efflux RND transporter permease subunit n=1 Tax=Rhodovastum atsumiense TaxID=504468 RepID=A0A5M6IZI1_9PROT|nr:efflux RND transporter permease subunit [Rhodovastum atsumiense]KAA5613703.1 efflux RND transporter permease subunit [Rhodovastum atsumiense]CAH2599625.1 Efflux RND transporter permease subunit [Rhodovastum atsumiense]